MKKVWYLANEVFGIITSATFIVLFIPLSVAGQVSFGVKGGLNISEIVMTNYVNPDVERDLTLKTGLHAGVFVSTMLEDRFGISGELLYSNKGVRGLENIHLHYVTLPLLGQYRLGEHVFAEFGFEPAYLFSARSTHGDVSSTYNNRFDLSLDGGLGLDTPKLIFGVRYCVGLFSVRDVVETQVPGGDKIKYQNRVIQLTIGYKLFKLE